MTSFHDSSRRRIGGPDGRPCWLAAAAALPALHVLPAADGWQIDLIVDGSWKSLTIRDYQLMRVLEEWRFDPEETLRVWWGCAAPSGRGPAEGPFGPSQIVQADPDELGL